jgi:hypothetical protein
MDARGRVGVAAPPDPRALALATAIGTPKVRRPGRPAEAEARRTSIYHKVDFHPGERYDEPCGALGAS